MASLMSPELQERRVCGLWPWLYVALGQLGRYMINSFGDAPNSLPKTTLICDSCKNLAKPPLQIVLAIAHPPAVAWQPYGSSTASASSSSAARSSYVRDGIGYAKRMVRLTDETCTLNETTKPNIPLS